MTDLLLLPKIVMVMAMQQLKSTDEFIAITDQRGNPIGDKTYSGWSLLLELIKLMRLIQLSGNIIMLAYMDT